MKHVGLFTYLSVIALLCFIASPVFALQIPKTHLVSAEWLAKNINNPHLVVVDVRARKAYQAGHIPHAVNVSKSLIFQKGYIGNIKHMLDTPKVITKTFRNAGISNNSVVVFYSYSLSPKGYTYATREFYTAWVYGLKNIAILNGGIGAWYYALHKPLSKTIVIPKKGDFTITNMQLRSIATWADIYYTLATKKVQLIDAREPAHFNGTRNDKRLLKHGHIPGAVEIAYYKFTERHGNYYEFVSAGKVRNILSSKHISLYVPIIDYCNTGHLATGDWFAIKFLAGAKNIRMYDGSMYEYTRMPLPVSR